MMMLVIFMCVWLMASFTLFFVARSMHIESITLGQSLLAAFSIIAVALVYVFLSLFSAGLLDPVINLAIGWLTSILLICWLLQIDFIKALMLSLISGTLQIGLMYVTLLFVGLNILQQSIQFESFISLIDAPLIVSTESDAAYDSELAGKD